MQALVVTHATAQLREIEISWRRPVEQYLSLAETTSVAWAEASRP